MKIQTLINQLKEYEELVSDEICYDTPTIKGITLIKIRDFLMINGSILKENLEKKTYIGYIKIGGFRKRILVAISIENEKLSIVMNHKNNSKGKKILNKLITEISSENLIIKRNKYKIIAFLGFILLIIYILFLLPAVTATQKYNQCVQEFNNVLVPYNEKVSLISVDNIQGVPGHMEYIDIEREDYFSITVSLLKGNFAPIINKDSNTLTKLTDRLNECMPILDVLNNPTENWVAEKLKCISDIKTVSSVTKSNDPNGLLDVEGGYSSCTYFTVKGIEFTNKNDDPIFLGNDGGGCIEVYNNVRDAKKRCEYLSQYDNTMLYSGSYVLVGTMVIRTSYVLTEEQQFILTNNIIESFTS